MSKQDEADKVSLTALEIELKRLMQHGEDTIRQKEIPVFHGSTGCTSAPPVRSIWFPAYKTKYSNPGEVGHKKDQNGDAV